MYHTGDKRFASAVPYASIIVELDDAPGALLAGNLLEAPYTEAKVGRRVEVIFEKLNDDITLPQFRLAPTRRSRREGRSPHVGEPVQGRRQRRGLFQGHPLGRDPARRACARRRSRRRSRTPGCRCPTSTGWRPIRNCRRPGMREVDGISIVSVNCMMAMLKLPEPDAGTSRWARSISAAPCSRRSTRCSPACANTRWCGGRCTTRAAPTRTCPAPTRTARRSSPRPTASAVRGRAWRSPTPAGSSGTTRTARRWRHSR